MKQRVISLRTLREKQFKILAFDGQWKEWLGQPESNFKAVFWGKSGSGKSTLVLRLCDYLAKFGKVGYNSWEEGIAKTFQDRVESNKIQNLDKIFLLEKYSFEEMMSDDFKRKSYKVVVIDSSNYMNLTYEQFKQLINRYPSKIFIIISQMNGKGKIKGGTDILHAADIKVFCYEGTAKVESRFAEEKRITIFERRKKAGEQLSLDINPQALERGVNTMLNGVMKEVLG
jgi:predicted ATP-dependent serine protease